MQWISFRRNTHCFVWKLSEGVNKGVKLLPQLNNTSHKANLVEQKQSISDLKSWQITTCDAKADWHFRWWEGGNLYFKAIQHETSCTRKMACKYELLRISRSYLFLICFRNVFQANTTWNIWLEVDGLQMQEETLFLMKSDGNLNLVNN